MIYIAILVLLIILSYNYDYQKKSRGKSFWFNVVLVILILVAGLRYRIGLDSTRYEMYHIEIPMLWELEDFNFDEENYDPLFVILSSLARTISSEFWVVQLLQAILVNTIVFRFIRLNTKNIFFGILLYCVCLYLNFMCEVMREACAVSMLLLGYEYLKQDKIIKFSAFIVLAYLFHSSAIVLFAIPLLKIVGVWDNLRLNRYSVFVFLGILLIGYYLQSTMFDFLQDITITDRVDSKVESYANDEILNKRNMNLLGILSRCVTVIFPTILSVIVTKRIGATNQYSKLEPFAMLCISFAILSVPIALFYRYNNYFFPFILILMSECMYRGRVSCIVNQRNINIGAISRTFILFSVMIQLYNFVSTPDGTSGYKRYQRYYPYASVIDKTIDVERENLFMYYNNW